MNIINPIFSERKWVCCVYSNMMSKFNLLCLFKYTVFIQICCVYSNLLCLFEYAVFIRICCVYLNMLCLFESAVFIQICCVYSICCFYSNMLSRFNLLSIFEYAVQIQSAVEILFHTYVWIFIFSEYSIPFPHLWQVFNFFSTPVACVLLSRILKILSHNCCVYF